MKTLIKAALTFAFLFTPAWAIILPAVAVCVAMDVAGMALRVAFGYPAFDDASY